MDEEDLRDPVWLKIDEWLATHHKSWAWLGERLTTEKEAMSSGRMGNWSRRGVPANQYSAIAAALNESVDWMLGLAPPKGADPYKLSSMALRVAHEFDSLRDDRKQIEAFAQIIALISRLRGI